MSYINCALKPLVRWLILIFKFNVYCLMFDDFRVVKILLNTESLNVATPFCENNYFRSGQNQ